MVLTYLWLPKICPLPSSMATISHQSLGWALFRQPRRPRPLSPPPPADDSRQATDAQRNIQTQYTHTHTHIRTHTRLAPARWPRPDPTRIPHRLPTSLPHLLSTVHTIPYHTYRIVCARALVDFTGITDPPPPLQRICICLCEVLPTYLPTSVYFT